MFEAGHFLCSSEDIPCVQSRTFLMLQTRHFVCSNHQHCTCHFLVNSADRPRIWANRNQIRRNHGTIGRKRQKMECKIFELRTAQKSRGWLRFQRFFDEIDRIAPNFFFENCAPPEKIFVEPIRTEISARPIRDRRPDRTGPDFGTDPTDRTNIAFHSR